MQSQNMDVEGNGQLHVFVVFGHTSPIVFLHSVLFEQKVEYDFLAT